MKKIYLFATSKSEYAINIKSLAVRFLIPSIDFSKYNHLIITSKQIIKALQNYDKTLFMSIPALCVSQKTASAYSKFGGKVLDFGNGYGDELIHNILKYPKDKKWLYLRGEVVVSDFAKKAKELGFTIDEEILYVSECSQEILAVRVNDDSTLIFTSPSAIECFLKNNTIHPNARVIVIGTTTAASLPEGVKYEISKTTSIESCVEAALAK